jgi:hypothetical protein
MLYLKNFKLKKGILGLKTGKKLPKAGKIHNSAAANG